MLKHIHDIETLPELFEKLKYETNRYGASYTAMLFDLKDESYFAEFGDFLLKYLRISDTIFIYGENKYLVVLEETTVRGAMILNERLREKIKDKGLVYDYFCASVQGNFIDDLEKLKKKLKKRLKKAHECNTTECVYTLSCMG